MTEPFGFKIRYSAETAYDPIAGWRVYLPHQCDSWDIAGEYWAPVPREDAIAELERFIAEAQATLAELRTAPEIPEADDD